MSDQQNKSGQADDQMKDQQQSEGTAPSMADQKNRDAGDAGANPVSRVKPQSGDGLANEGTIVDYSEQR